MPSKLRVAGSSPAAPTTFLRRVTRVRYIDRRFLFPVAAVTAWAQQPAPAAAEAEAALRARAEQFFQLQADKKFRPAEAMVADDTKDLYYNGRKFNINSFSIEKIELLEDNTRAKVTIKTKVTRAVPVMGIVVFDAPATTLWRLENGQWVYYIDQAAALETPFGTVNEQKGSGAPPPSSPSARIANLSALQNLVKIDKNSVDLALDGPSQTVTVSNELPGAVDLELQVPKIAGLSVQLEKKHLEAGEKTVIRLSATGKDKGTGVVHLVVSPIAAQLDISVRIS
jgi:hypothetical protein